MYNNQLPTPYRNLYALISLALAGVRSQKGGKKHTHSHSLRHLREAHKTYYLLAINSMETKSDQLLLRIINLEETLSEDIRVLFSNEVAN